MNVDEAKEITGGLTATSKMPCKSYSIPSCMCNIGSQLKGVKGATCEHCYTYRYQRYAHVIEKQFERYSKLFNPQWARAMAVLIKNENNHYFRWHDSGDIQSLEHIEQIVVACICTPLVAHWLPTLEAGSHIATFVQKYGSIDKIDNLCVRASTPFINGRAMPNGNTGVRASRVIADDRTLKKEMLTFMNDNICPAKLGDGTCGDCRKCWDKDIDIISYPLKLYGHMLGVEGLILQ